MRRTRSPLTLLASLASLAPLACEGDDPTPDAQSIPPAVQRAFEGSCMHDGCHQATAPAAGLSLDAAHSAAIVGGPSSQSALPLVVVGDLGGSYMAIKLLPDDQLPAGAERHEERMPLDGIESDDVERINTILSWIAGFSPEDTDGGSASGTIGDTDGSASASASGTTGDSGDPTDPTDSGPTTNTGGGPTHPACSVEAVTEDEVTSPLDKGSGAGQIPQLVGVVLEERCGCHTLTNRGLNTKFPGLLAPGGSLFLDYGDVTALGGVIHDEIFVSYTMPPGSCPGIPTDDLAVLDKWFADGLPDGATFVPP
ncbi:MAG: hypothetical protein KDK70_13010 [Myxococcales bacterium]|nr:hypothetical protein [Myxococcales bacterium]